MLRQLRCYASSVVLLGPLGLLAGAQGCSDEAPVENLCTWLVDSSNCAARFAEDVGARCGRPYVEDAEPNGEFYVRDTLDMCVLYEGGQVMFDPPLSPTAFPPAAFTMQFIDERAESCGSAAYSGHISFGVTINAVSLPDGDTIAGGSYTSTQEPGRDVFDVTCPGGAESHHFNALLVEKCPEAAPYVPQVIVDTNPGVPPLPSDPTGEGTPGYVRVAIQYPSVIPPGAQDDPESWPAPVIVEYANCAVPPPPHPCADGVLNFGETDIDCGGPGVCPRCQSGQRCVDADDCLATACALSDGVRVCQ